MYNLPTKEISKLLHDVLKYNHAVENTNAITPDAEVDLVATKMMWKDCILLSDSLVKAGKLAENILKILNTRKETLEQLHANTLKSEKSNAKELSNDKMKEYFGMTAVQIAELHCQKQQHAEQN